MAAEGLGYGLQLARFVGFVLIKRRQQRQDAEVIPNLLRRPSLTSSSSPSAAVDTTKTMDKRDAEEIHGTAAMRDAEIYLSQLGIPTGLPPLQICYDTYEHSATTPALASSTPRTTATATTTTTARTSSRADASNVGKRGGGGGGEGGGARGSILKGTHVITAGERLSSRHDGFLQAEPVVHWPNVPDANNPHTVRSPHGALLTAEKTTRADYFLFDL